MQNDVILVTFNYRLSVLGFLSLSDPSLNVPGNAGLKDQVLALKWVRNNIAKFGGDDENITLFGESAGAASVHFMLCTEQAKGLFHKAICMSGCILNNWAFTRSATDLGYRLACAKGYNGENDDRAVLEYLKNLPGNELLDTTELNHESVAKGGFYAFVPTIEPYDSTEAIVTKPLLELLKIAWGNDVPLMIGGNSFEGLVRYPYIKHRPEFLELYKTSLEKLLPPELKEGISEDQQQTYVKAIRNLHFPDIEGDKQKLTLNCLDVGSKFLLPPNSYTKLITVSFK